MEFIQQSTYQAFQWDGTISQLGLYPWILDSIRACRLLIANEDTPNPSLTLITTTGPIQCTPTGWFIKELKEVYFYDNSTFQANFKRMK